MRRAGAGQLLGKICHKSTLSPKPLYHSPLLEYSTTGVVECRKATHYLSGSESRRARRLMLSKESKDYS